LLTVETEFASLAVPGFTLVVTHILALAARNLALAAAFLVAAFLVDTFLVATFLVDTFLVAACPAVRILASATHNLASAAACLAVHIHLAIELDWDWFLGNLDNSFLVLG